MRGEGEERDRESEWREGEQNNRVIRRMSSWGREAHELGEFSIGER